MAGQTLYFGSLLSKDTGDAEGDGCVEDAVDNVGNELVLDDLPSLVVVGLSTSNVVDRSTLSFSPSNVGEQIVGEQNRTRELDRERRSLVSSSNADDDVLVRGCERPRDLDSRRPLDDDLDDLDDCFSPPDPSFVSFLPPLIRPFRLTNALHTESADEHVLLFSNIHIGHESKSTFHPFVRGDRRCICTKGWEGHRPCESTGAGLLISCRL